MTRPPILRERDSITHAFGNNISSTGAALRLILVAIGSVVSAANPKIESLENRRLA